MEYSNPHSFHMPKEFSYSKSVANFEAFCWNFSSSTNPEIVRCVTLHIFGRNEEDMEETRFRRKYIKWIGCSTQFQHIAEGEYILCYIWIE